MTGRQDVFQQAMNQGHSAAWDQAWDRAASFYQKALDEFPDHTQALNNLGLALFELQEFERAITIYKHAARMAPQDPVPVEKLAQLFERTGNLEQACQAALSAAELYLKNQDVNRAIENWLRVARLNPENLRAHTRLALVYERLGEKEKAVAEYLGIAGLFQDSGSLDKALRAIQQALQIIPEQADAVKAMQWLKESRPLPKPVRPKGGTGPLLMAQIRQLQAPKTPDQVDTNADPIEQACQMALTTLAGILFEIPEQDQLENPTRRSIFSIESNSQPGQVQTNQAKINAQINHSIALQTEEDYSEAARELKHAVDAGLKHPAAHFNLGYLLFKSDQNEQALRELRLAVKNIEYALGAQLLIGEILRRTEHPSEAAIAFLEALKLADTQIVPAEQADGLRQLYDTLIDVQKQKQDAQIQQTLCENIYHMLVVPDWQARLLRAREQLPVSANGTLVIPLAELLTEAQSSRVVEAIARITDLSNQGKIRTAMEGSFFAIELAPTYLPLHAFVGDILLKQGLFQQAVDKFIIVARAYSIRGEYQRAIDLYRRIIGLAPMDMNARTRLIDELVTHHQIEEAIQEYLKLAEMHYNLADLDMVRKTYAEALRMAQQAKVDHTWIVEILHRMADIDLQSLDWRQAIRVYEQIRTLRPDDEKARSSLIEINFRLGQDALALAEIDNFISTMLPAGKKEKLVGFIEKEVQDHPERLVVRKRLAELYRQIGRLPDAVRQYDLVGRALLASGDRLGAMHTIETILALNPPNQANYQVLLGQLKKQGN